MWEPFSNDARQSIVRAHELALASDTSFIGSQHLLLGMMGLGKGTAFDVLHNARVSTQDLNDAVRQAYGSPARVKEKEPVFTPEVKRIIEKAFEQARLFRHRFIGTGHLLLAMINDEGALRRVFDTLHLDREALRRELTERLRDR